MPDMSWHLVSAMDARVQFVTDYQRETFSMTELCRRYGISRQAGYETLERYRKDGAAGLAPRSRRPEHSPSATADEIVKLIKGLRARYPSFGPKKLLRVLRRRHRRSDWPAPSTVALVLKREGLIAPRRRRTEHGVHVPTARIVPAAPNELWSVDFKGQFRTGDHRYCYPLTIADRFSRYLLDCHGMLSPSEAGTFARFRHVFEEFGVPDAIRSDNGVPFASTALAGLSHLSLWWLRLGIRLDRIRRGHPEENGGHEYMHRVLKRETARPPAPTCEQQQVRFEAFRPMYNYIRPHEALGQVVPGDLYRPSFRSLPAQLPVIEYPGHFEVRRVTDGAFSWHSHRVFLTHVLTGELVGLAEVDDGVWTVYFCHQPIGRFDERTNHVTETHEQAESSKQKPAVDAAGAVDAKSASTAPWKTRGRVSHSAHRHHRR
jgi:putative transposase